MKRILAISAFLVSLGSYAISSETACLTLKAYAIDLVTDTSIGSIPTALHDVTNDMAIIRSNAATVDSYLQVSMMNPAAVGGANSTQSQAHNALSFLDMKADSTAREALYALNELAAAQTYFRDYDCGSCPQNEGPSGSNDCCVPISEMLSVLDIHMTTYLSQIRSNQEAMRSLVNILGNACLVELAGITNELRVIESSLTNSTGHTVADLTYFMLTNLQPMAVSIDEISLRLASIDGVLHYTNEQGQAVYVLPEIYKALDKEIAMLSTVTNDIGLLSRFFISSSGTGNKFFSDYANLYRIAESDEYYVYISLLESLFDHTSYDWGESQFDSYRSYLQHLCQSGGFVQFGFGGDWSYELEALNYSTYKLYKTLWGVDDRSINYSTNLVQAIYNALIDRNTGSNFLQNVTVNQGLFQDIVTEGFSGLGDVTNLIEVIITNQIATLEANTNFFALAFKYYEDFTNVEAVATSAYDNYVLPIDAEDLSKGYDINYNYYETRPWFERLEFLLRFNGGGGSLAAQESSLEDQQVEGVHLLDETTNGVSQLEGEFYGFTNIFDRVYAPGSNIVAELSRIFDSSKSAYHGSPNLRMTLYTSSQQFESFLSDGLTIDMENDDLMGATYNQVCNVCRDAFVIIWGMTNVVTMLFLIFKVAKFTTYTIIINGLLRFSQSLIARRGN